MERLVTRAIILDENKKVLLGRRAGGIGANQWALVGGKPDENETPETAVMREVVEELGVRFINVQFCSEAVNRETDWKTYFFTWSIEGVLDLNPNEILEIRYVTETDLDMLDIAFDHKERLMEFFKNVL